MGGPLSGITPRSESSIFYISIDITFWVHLFCLVEKSKSLYALSNPQNALQVRFSRLFTPKTLLNGNFPENRGCMSRISSGKSLL